MPTAYLSLLLAVNLVPSDPPATLEQEILQALSEGKTAETTRLGQQLEALSPEMRRLFPIRVRPGVLEWEFAGEHPADQLSHQMLEYVVSSEAKEYESLLVVDDDQLQRARRLGKALQAFRSKHPQAEVDVRLVWSANRRVRMVRLWDMLPEEKPEQRLEFTRKLAAFEEGLGSFNVKANQAALPKKRRAAQVFVTVRLPAQ